MPHKKGRNHWTAKRCPGSLQQLDLEHIETNPEGFLKTICPVCRERVGVVGKQRVGMHPKPEHAQRMKIHINNNPPFDDTVNRLRVCLMDGTVIRECKQVKLMGEWTLRQYNNPVPCGELTVLYPETTESNFVVEC